VTRLCGGSRPPSHPLDVILDDLLGELEPAVSADLRSHLARCEACRAEEREWREVLSLAARAPGQGLRCPSRWPSVRRLGRRAAGVAGKLRLSSAGTAAAPRAEGRLVQWRDGSMELVVRGLRPLPLGQVYVLWAQDGTEMRFVVAFAVDGGGRGRCEASWPAGVPRAGEVRVTAERLATVTHPSHRLVLTGRWP
jgi:anti-sigma factor RsiW